MCGGLPSVYVASGDKPGKGYPDLWEYLNLTMYPMYAAMDNHDPALDRELRVLDEIEKRLRSDYPDIHIARGFGAARPGYPHFLDAAKALVKYNNLDKLIIAQNYIIQSDFENPAGEIENYLSEKGYDVEVVIAGQIGGTEPFSKGVAEKALEELNGNSNIGNDPIPDNKNILVLLFHHGMLSTNMILYDFAEEPYHEFAREAFNACADKIMNLPEVESWTGEFMILQVYPEMSTGILDPRNEHLSVDEAMEIAENLSFEYVIGIPYEVGNSGYETLWGLRGAWGIDPVWDTYEEDNGIDGTLMTKYRNSFNRDGINVVITDGWINGAADGYYEQIELAINSVR
jgi:hypothetical protein